MIFMSIDIVLNNGNKTLGVSHLCSSHFAFVSFIPLTSCFLAAYLTEILSCFFMHDVIYGHSQVTQEI